MRVYVLLVHVMDWDSIWDDHDQISTILIILSFIVIEEVSGKELLLIY